MAEQKRVYFSKIERRNGHFYAQLRDLQTHEIVIAATLDYVLKAVEAQNYKVVDACDVKTMLEGRISELSWAADPRQGGI
jgi:hypothetical protein